MLLKKVHDPKTAYSLAVFGFALAGVMGMLVRTQVSDYWQGAIAGVRLGLIFVALKLVWRARRLD